MAANNNSKKGTDRDVKPTRGQESNENWDQNNDQKTSAERPDSGSNARRTNEETNTSGAGSSQRSKADNVAPLDPDLEQLPSEKRMDRNNKTGPGLG